MYGKFGVMSGLKYAGQNGQAKVVGLGVSGVGEGK